MLNLACLSSSTTHLFFIFWVCIPHASSPVSRCFSASNSAVQLMGTKQRGHAEAALATRLQAVGTLSWPLLLTGESLWNISPPNDIRTLRELWQIPPSWRVVFFHISHLTVQLLKLCVVSWIIQQLCSKCIPTARRLVILIRFQCALGGWSPGHLCQN